MMASACCVSGLRPAFEVATAVPAGVWVCSAQAISGLAMWMAEWITKPAGLMCRSVGERMRAALVHLDQRRGGDLVEEQPVGVDEEGVLLSGRRAPRCACREDPTSRNGPPAGRQAARSTRVRHSASVHAFADLRMLDRRFQVHWLPPRFGATGRRVAGGHHDLNSPRVPRASGPGQGRAGIIAPGRGGRWR